MQTTQAGREAYITVVELSHRLGIPTSTIRTALRLGNFPNARQWNPNGTWHILESEALAWEQSSRPSK